MLLVEKIWNQPALFVTAVVFYLSVQYLAYLFKRSKRLKIKELWV